MRRAFTLLALLSLPLVLEGCQGDGTTLRSVRRQLAAGEFTKPKPSPEGVLTDQHGEAFDLGRALDGKLGYVFFGYTSCPDICPLSMATLSRALEQLTEAERSQVLTVFITLDPARDTPERLAAWLGAFGNDIVGLTSSAEHLEVVLGQFGYAQPHAVIPAEGPYEVAHPPDIFTITPDGFIRFGYVHDVSPSDIADDARRLLRVEW